MISQSLKPGQRLGSFKLGEKLGEGTYGTVYAATRASESGRFALKVCDLHEPGAKKVKGMVPKSQGANLLFQEYNAFVNILSWHPSLPVLPDDCYGDGEGVRWLALQLLEGGTLASRLGEHTGVSLATVAILALQLLDVLAHVHATGYVYCDLNLENVMLGGPQPARGMNAFYPGARTHRGVGGRARLIAAGPLPALHAPGERAYLVDFGMATEYVAHTGARVGAEGARGTPLFSSPSHALGAPLSPKDDLVCLGYLLAAAAGGVQALPWAAAPSDESATADHPKAPSFGALGSQIPFRAA